MSEPWATARLTLDTAHARATWWRAHLLDIERQLGLAAMMVGVPAGLLGIEPGWLLALAGTGPWVALLVQTWSGRHRVVPGPITVECHDTHLRIERPFVVWDVGWRLVSIHRVVGGAMIRLPNAELVYVPTSELEPPETAPRLRRSARPPYPEGADRHVRTARSPSIEPSYQTALAAVIGEERAMTCRDLMLAACAMPSLWDRLVAAGIDTDKLVDGWPAPAPLGTPDLANPFEAPRIDDGSEDALAVLRRAMARDPAAVIRAEIVLEELWGVPGVRTRLRASGWPRPLPAAAQRAPVPAPAVVLWNDDRTPMHLVVDLVQRHTGAPRVSAVRVMLRVHLDGSSAVAVDADPATVAATIEAEARQGGWPLRVTVSGTGAEPAPT